MYRPNSHQDEEFDARLNESLSEVELDDPALGVDELHKARIDEFEQASLRRENPLLACLGAANANLMRIGLRHQQAFNNAFNAEETNILDSPVLQRAISTQLAVTRQVERLANVEVRQCEAERQAEQTKSQRSLAALHRPSESSMRRNRN